MNTVTIDCLLGDVLPGIISRSGSAHDICACISKLRCVSKDFRRTVDAFTRDGESVFWKAVYMLLFNDRSIKHSICTRCSYSKSCGVACNVSALCSNMNSGFLRDVTEQNWKTACLMNGFTTHTQSRACNALDIVDLCCCSKHFVATFNASGFYSNEGSIRIMRLCYTCNDSHSDKRARTGVRLDKRDASLPLCCHHVNTKEHLVINMCLFEPPSDSGAAHAVLYYVLDNGMICKYSMLDQLETFITVSQFTTVVQVLNDGHFVFSTFHSVVSSGMQYFSISVCDIDSATIFQRDGVVIYGSIFKIIPYGMADNAILVCKNAMYLYDYTLDEGVTPQLHSDGVLPCSQVILDAVVVYKRRMIIVLRIRNIVTLQTMCGDVIRCVTSSSIPSFVFPHTQQCATWPSILLTSFIAADDNGDSFIFSVINEHICLRHRSRNTAALWTVSFDELFFDLTDLSTPMSLHKTNMLTMDNGIMTDGGSHCVFISTKADHNTNRDDDSSRHWQPSYCGVNDLRVMNHHCSASNYFFVLINGRFEVWHKCVAPVAPFVEVV